jgi:formylglycine-generating enzyme required for sulfatase activity
VRNGSTVLILTNGDRLRPQDLPTLIYLPDPGAAGDAGALRYLVDDGHGGKVEGRVQIEVAALDDATRLLSESKLWHRLRDQGDIADVQSFQRLFPESQYAGEARQRERELSPSGLASAGSTTSSETPAASTPAAVVRMPSASPAPTAVQASATPSPATPSPPPAAAAPATPTLTGAHRRGSESKVAAAGSLPAPTAAPSDRATFKDCVECPTMVQIAAGSFVMGQASGDPTAAPARTVSVRRFALAQRPVTMAEWKACVAAGGCAAVRLTEGDEWTSMHNLSWDDGQQYVAWLSKKTGHRYRLPTEAEWEYAARASTVTRYWWGDQVGVGLANCSDCGGEQDKSGPLPVDAFKPNPFGLLDPRRRLAVGGRLLVPELPGRADGRQRTRSQELQRRVLRGGSFRNDRNNITVSVRNYYDAAVRYVGNGLRVAADLQ